MAAEKRQIQNTAAPIGEPDAASMNEPRIVVSTRDYDNNFTSKLSCG